MNAIPTWSTIHMGIGGQVQYSELTSRVTPPFNEEVFPILISRWTKTSVQISIQERYSDSWISNGLNSPPKFRQGSLCSMCLSIWLAQLKHKENVFSITLGIDPGDNESVPIVCCLWLSLLCHQSAVFWWTKSIKLKGTQYIINFAKIAIIKHPLVVSPLASPQK